MLEPSIAHHVMRASGSLDISSLTDLDDIINENNNDEDKPLQTGRLICLLGGLSLELHMPVGTISEWQLASKTSYECMIL